MVSLMGKLLEKYAGSIRFLGFSFSFRLPWLRIYFAVYGLQFSLQLTSDHYVYGLVTKNPWWWIILYYGSEGVAGSVAIVLRAVRRLLCVLRSFPVLEKKRRGNANSSKECWFRALGLEAGFFLALIPSIIAAFAYNLTS